MAFFVYSWPGSGTPTNTNRHPHGYTVCCFAGRVSVFVWKIISDLPLSPSFVKREDYSSLSLASLPAGRQGEGGGEVKYADTYCIQQFLVSVFLLSFNSPPPEGCRGGFSKPRPHPGLSATPLLEGN